MMNGNDDDDDKTNGDNNDDDLIRRLMMMMMRMMLMLLITTMITDESILSENKYSTQFSNLENCMFSHECTMRHYWLDEEAELILAFCIQNRAYFKAPCLFSFRINNNRIHPLLFYAHKTTWLLLSLWLGHLQISNFVEKSAREATRSRCMHGNKRTGVATWDFSFRCCFTGFTIVIMKTRGNSLLENLVHLCWKTYWFHGNLLEILLF